MTPKSFWCFLEYPSTIIEKGLVSNSSKMYSFTKGEIISVPIYKILSFLLIKKHILLYLFMELRETNFMKYYYLYKNE